MIVEHRFPEIESLTLTLQTIESYRPFLSYSTTGRLEKFPPSSIYLNLKFFATEIPGWRENRNINHALRTSVDGTIRFIKIFVSKNNFSPPLYNDN